MWRILLGLAIGIAVAAGAIMGLNFRTPLLATPWSPPNGSEKSNLAPTTFTWRVGGTVIDSPFIRRPSADYFVVCVREFTSLDDMKCEYSSTSGTGDGYVHVGPVASFMSRPGGSGSNWAELIRFYDHTVDDLGPDLQDKELMWTVAVCASTSDSSCGAAPALRFREVDMDLRVRDAAMGAWDSSPPNRTLLNVHTRIVNSPHSNPGPFKVRMELAQVYTDSSGSVDKDLTNYPADSNYVLTKRGDEVLIQDFLQQMGQPSDHKGVIIPGGYRSTLYEDVQGMTPGQTVRLDLQDTVSALGNATATNRVRIAIVSVVDSENAVAETDEDNNFGDDGASYPPGP